MAGTAPAFANSTCTFWLSELKSVGTNPLPVIVVPPLYELPPSRISNMPLTALAKTDPVPVMLVA